MNRLQRGPTVEEIQAKIGQAKSELSTFQHRNRLTREEAEANIERYLRTVRSLEREVVG